MYSALIREKLSKRFATAARPPWAAMWSVWSSAIRAGISPSRITPAGTDIVQSVRQRRAPNGWPRGKPNYCLSLISTLYSRCRRRSACWHFRMHARFIASCSARHRKHCSLSRPIPGVWARRSVFWPCCIRGGRTFIFIRISTAPGGGISDDGTRWVACRKSSFFLPVQVLSCRFRNVFLTYLREAFRKGKLQFHGEIACLARPGAFEALCRQAGRIKWVVFAKPPFGGPEQVMN